MAMHDPSAETRAMAIAIRLIHSQDVKNIETLKKFLTFIPDPRCVQNVLTQAVIHISETSTETTNWLLENPEPFQPEINVIEVIAQNLSQTNKNTGE